MTELEALQLIHESLEFMRTEFFLYACAIILALGWIGGHQR